MKFTDISLNPKLIESLELLNYTTMTDAQAESLPEILSGNDVITQAKTGSGKTAAFGIGLLQSLDQKKYQPQSLVLCPTRELADQVANELRKLARKLENVKIVTICGGMPFPPQIASLKNGVQIIVGTPGRVEDHIRKERVKLDHIKTLVLDEADRMLDMGFKDSLAEITKALPVARQTLLFSATFPKAIKDIAARVMKNPIKIEVKSANKHENITQHFYKIKREDSRIDALRILLEKHESNSTVIFCNTKSVVKNVVEELIEFGHSVGAIHGELNQKQREETLIQFMNKSKLILVATDVAARGIDISDLGLVVNYEITPEFETHTHRIGRTGRAENKGTAISIFTAGESKKIDRLEGFLKHGLKIQELDTDSVKLKKPQQSTMTTLRITGGKKDKIRAGDILGALTTHARISGDMVGKINVNDMYTYVSIDSDFAVIGQKQLRNGKIKGRTFRVNVLNF